MAVTMDVAGAGCGAGRGAGRGVDRGVDRGGERWHWRALAVAGAGIGGSWPWRSSIDRR